MDERPYEVRVEDIKDLRKKIDSLKQIQKRSLKKIYISTVQVNFFFV